MVVKPSWTLAFSRGGCTGADGGLGAGDGGLIGVDGLGAGVGAGAQLLRLVLGNHAGLEQFGVAFGLRVLIFGVGLVARHVGLGLEERGVVAGDIGHHLVVGGFQRARIDVEELLALLDEIAFLEIDVDQLAADLGLNRDRGIGFDVADDLDLDRNVAVRGVGHGDGNIATATAALSATSAAGSVCFRGSGAAIASAKE